MEQIKDAEVSTLLKIILIVFVILCLLYLAFTGGNNQNWHPGKPYNER